MERLFRLTADLACVGCEEDLPAGTLAVEPRLIRRDEIGADWVFLGSRDLGRTWREYATVVENAWDWFELLAPTRCPS